MVRRTTVVLGMGLVLVAGCSSGSDAAAPSASTTAAQVGAAGNGTLYTSLWDTTAGTLTITGHPIGADGSLGAAAPLLSDPADDTTFPGVVDGVGDATVTGSFTDYWTTDVEVRVDGQVTGEVAAPRWCGGEGLTYTPCALLDSTRLARTTELGRDPETGDGPSEGSVLVSSLADGSTIAEYGPFADLSMMLGTGTPDEVLLVTTPAQSAEDPGVPSTVMVLDVTDGSTTEVGDSPVGWAPLCPIGADSVLGFTMLDAPTAAVVGPAPVGAITWDQQDSVVGCSADGRFMFVQRIPQPPTEEVEDTEPPNPSTTVERITLADGSRSEVLVLPPGELAGPITR